MTQFGSYQESIEILEKLFLHHIVMRDASIINLCIQKLEAAQPIGTLDPEVEAVIHQKEQPNLFDDGDEMEVAALQGTEKQ